jgi:hypothetical protein
MLDFQSMSSFLTESIRGVLYKYDDVDKYYYSLNTPWVEGKGNFGIGEWISKRIVRPADKVLILNGFIDAKRPYLFESNSRVKRIEVSSKEGKWDYNLDDTPLPQILSFPVKVSGDIRFTIVDVFPGQKYKDTALSGVFFLDEFGK